MDRGAFAQRLDELLQNKAKAREMGANGLKLVSERYDFDGYISDLEQMFTEVAQHASPRLSRAASGLNAPAALAAA
jgi:glycosyltransferase involved in cell wall biosynthesis